MNRFVFWIGCAITSIALAFCVTDELVSRIPGVTERNFKRIKKGMTHKEVYAILGIPNQSARLVDGDWLTCVWHSKKLTVIVGFVRDQAHTTYLFWDWQNSTRNTLCD